MNKLPHTTKPVTAREEVDDLITEARVAAATLLGDLFEESEGRFEGEGVRAMLQSLGRITTRLTSLEFAVANLPDDDEPGKEAVQ